jgi:hypothetical protein
MVRHWCFLCELVFFLWRRRWQLYPSFISLFFLLPPFLPLRSLAAGKPFDDSPPLRDLRHIAIGIAGSQTGESLGGGRETHELEG